MNDVKGMEQVKAIIVKNAIILVVALCAIVGYLLFRMKKRNVKIFGR